MKPILLTAEGNLGNQADGAGGRSGGAEAANLAVELVRQHASTLTDSTLCADLLRKMDTTIGEDAIAGETTCALAVVTPEKIFGASVGDSGVWLIADSRSYVDLTPAQQRKPLIGCRVASPVPFRCVRPGGTLLLATDGLLKYASAERIVETCCQNPTELAAQQLIELVRYRSGDCPMMSPLF